MPINKPTEQDLRDTALNIFRKNFGSATVAKYSSTFIYPIIAAFSKIVAMLFTYAERLLDDRFVYTASEEALYNRHYPAYKVARITAVKATGTIQFTGVNGSVIPSGSYVVSDTGLRFLTDSEVTISGGTGNTTITAENVGDNYNLAVSTELFLESEFDGVDESGTLTVATTGGKDLESLESWRERMAQAAANAVGAGSKSDIIQWIQDAIGDVNGQVFPRTPTNGEIQITYTQNNPDQLAPTSGGLSAAVAYVTSKVEDGVTVNSIQPAGYPINFQIKLDPNDSATQSAIETALKDYFMEFSKVSVNGFLHKLYRSQIIEFISTSVGEVKHEILQIDYNGTLIFSNEVIDIPHGTLASLGDITWSAY